MALDHARHQSVAAAVDDVAFDIDRVVFAFGDIGDLVAVDCDRCWLGRVGDAVPYRRASYGSLCHFFLPCRVAF